MAENTAREEWLALAKAHTETIYADHLEWRNEIERSAKEAK
jgi:hypothetical protein